MERTTSSSTINTTTTSPRNKETNKGGMLSCFDGCLKLKIPWKKRNIIGRNNNTASNNNLPRQETRVGSGLCSNMTAALLRGNINNKRPIPPGGFRYDPSSYAQNFDEGVIWDDDVEEGLVRSGFTSRFVAPYMTTDQEKMTL